MKRLITDKSQMQCTLGASPMPLTVTSQIAVNISGGLIATEMDKIPMVNIPSFGVCNIYPNPPCVPSPIAWNATSELSTTCGQKSLTVDSFCMCALGGKISFIDTGKNTNVDSK